MTTGQDRQSQTDPAHPGDGMTIVDPYGCPPHTVAPHLIYVGDLTVPDYPGAARSQRYPVEVWEISNGFRFVILTAVYGNASPMNASTRIARTVRAQWDRVESIIEFWPDGLGDGHRFVVSSEDGGNYPTNFDELARLGLVIPEDTRHRPA